MSNKTELYGSIIFKIAAVSNFIVSIPVFIIYDIYVGMMTPIPPIYPFLVWIWCGMASLWGVMFWEISTDMKKKYSLIKYSYLEKSITSLSVLTAFLTENVPLSFFIMIIFTDIMWIPIFIIIHWKVTILTRKE
ncbi:MAG TPA: hypothetical protein VGB37_05395 [Candidatus Lokiarchaeia archaeon]